MSLTIPVEESLTLRLFEPRFAVEVYEVVDRDRDHLARWLSWPPQCSGPEDIAVHARKALAGFAEHTALSLNILERGRLVGGVGFTSWRQGVEFGSEFASADIGYWLAADATGRGIMTRCVRKLLDLGFNDYGLSRITIRCEPANTPSAGVPKRLGFKLEGVMRHVCRYADRWIDHELYAMLAEEWAEKRE